MAPLFQFLHPMRADPVLLTLLLPPPPHPPPQFFHSIEFFMVLYVLFHRPGTPVCFQLMFWLLFYVWRCMPDVHGEMYSISTYCPTILLSHLTMVLKHRIHSGSRCAIYSWGQVQWLQHGFSVGQTHASHVKKIIYRVTILEHKISSCITFAVECKFSCGRRYAPRCNWPISYISCYSAAQYGGNFGLVCIQQWLDAYCLCQWDSFRQPVLFFFFQTAHSKVQAHEWQNMFSRLQAKQFQYFYVRAKTQ